MGTPIIRATRYKDTRDGSKKTLIKILGDVLYFSDDSTETIEDFNKYYELAKANED